MILAPPPLLAYKVILSDPPWQFENYSEAGEAKSASQHYETMPTPEIAKLVRELLEWSCDPDAVHVMWTTWAMLARGDAHIVMEASGFKCVSGGAWFKSTKNDKDHIGLGYIFRDSCEPFLVGTRGKPSRRVKDVRNGFRAKVSEHSSKPEYLHRALERMYAGPYLELFARSRRPNWISWGNEVDGPRARPEPEPAPPSPTLFNQGGNT